MDGATPPATDRRCDDGRREDHEVGRAGHRGRVGGRDHVLGQVDPGQPALVPVRRVDLVRHLGTMGQEKDRFAPGDDRRQGRTPCPGPDHRDGRRGGHQRARRDRGDVVRRVGFGGAERVFRRRGSLTEARSRNTSRIGVPWNPNVSRNRFSR